MIRFHNVTKKFGNHIVLDKVNLDIKSGDFVSIIGVSGAGKSTLLHLLIGALTPNHGSVEVDKIVINDLDNDSLQIYRRELGIVFQDYKLLPKRNIYENIAFALEACGTTEREVEKRVPQVLKLVGLEHTAQNYPNELSGGEKQRVAIARALVHNPKMILADEPTGNLDHENTQAVIALLKDIHKHGITIVLATHDDEVIKTIKKRVIRLKDGKIEEVK